MPFIKEWNEEIARFSIAIVSTKVDTPFQLSSLCDRLHTQHTNCVSPTHRASPLQSLLEPKKERAENWSQSLNCSSALGYQISPVDEVDQEPSSSDPNSLIGRAGSAGDIFNPWSLMSLRWQTTKLGNGDRKVCGTAPLFRNTTFQTGPQHVSKFLYRGPLLCISPPRATHKPAH